MAKVIETPSVEEYLRELNHLLRHVPVQLRHELVADIAEHIDEGREQGRSDREIVTALGNAESVAAPVLEEVLLRGAAPTMKRNRRVLGIVAIVTGLFAAIVSRSSDSTVINMTFGPTEMQGASINYGYSDIFAASQLLIFISLGLMVAASAVMRPRIARSYSVAAAVVMTVVVIICGTGLGMFFVPSMVAAWLLAGVNNLKMGADQRDRRSRTVRIVGGIALLLPSSLAVAGILSGSVLGVGPYIFVALGLACSVGYLKSFRFAQWLACITGGLLMVMAIIDQGMLMAAFWLGGIMYFFFGLYGLLWFSDRRAVSTTVLQ